MLIQVGFLVSYDYQFLYNAIPNIYSGADTIFLALDMNRKTWKGETFSIESGFFDWIQKIDTEKKIVLYEDNFYMPRMSTMECEVRERKMLADQMGIGNWLLQIDADEYFVNFDRFKDYLQSHNHLFNNPHKTPVNVSPFSINLYKKVKEGYLVVAKPTKQWIATNMPEYVIGRKTRNPVLFHDSLMVHECLSRTREDLELKLDNWGHNADINKVNFLHKWDAVNENNYKTMQDFFYLDANRWKKLIYVKANSITELTTNIQNHKQLYPARIPLYIRNLKTRIKYLNILR
ncbi:hypothetical protein [Desulfosediminicola flagellatus]|uniref:hypothetical protein n=1 Tax=Desulfosediminicola flagellatus TaxID=2569541 RepID=UPI0010AB7AB6|nr:hypothetical protein [Desulfosediminicola flagellatus]